MILNSVPKNSKPPDLFKDLKISRFENSEALDLLKVVEDSKSLGIFKAFQKLRFDSYPKISRTINALVPRQALEKSKWLKLFEVPEP